MSDQGDEMERCERLSTAFWTSRIFGRLERSLLYALKIDLWSREQESKKTVKLFCSLNAWIVSLLTKNGRPRAKPWYEYFVQTPTATLLFPECVCDASIRTCT